MRQLCVDHARARRADKRGGDRIAVTLDEALAKSAGLRVDVLDLAHEPEIHWVRSASAEVDGLTDGQAT